MVGFCLLGMLGFIAGAIYVMAVQHEYTGGCVMLFVGAIWGCFAGASYWEPDL